MASDWNEELDKYENGRSFGEDLKDSLRATLNAASLVASNLPKSASSASRKGTESNPLDGVIGGERYIDGIHVGSE
ncbi:MULTISPECIES: hypothetical protein [Erwiniaceae]|uniref:hypothetical protein n=1 Tax=Erwiniaceae TaxID=1903409 RepID=UPI0024B6E6E3|nr:hypothetical protein [Pantoea ananatis]MDJ0033565.1 hypothetical protein [Pantoea ananatis]